MRMITLRIHTTPDGYEFTSSDNEIDFVIPHLCSLREKALTYWLNAYGFTLHHRFLREAAQAWGKSLKGEVVVTCKRADAQKEIQSQLEVLADEAIKTPLPAPPIPSPSQVVKLLKFISCNGAHVRGKVCGLCGGE